MRRQWLTGLIREVHNASRGTYGSRRVHAELTLALDVQASEHLVAVLMHNTGIHGLPEPVRIKRSRGVATTTGIQDRLDNAMMESFWSSMQIELLNRKRWKTRIDLANAIFEYIEIFHNR